MKRAQIIQWIPMFTIVFTLALDQITKVLIVQNLLLYEHVNVIGDYVRIRFILNEGMAFGLFSDLERPFKDILFSSFTLISIGIVTYYYRMIHKEHSWSRFYFALILGGALGNLTDKIFGYIIFKGKMKLFYGKVVDFIDIGIDSCRWATFNVADIVITVGVFSLLYIILFRKDQDIIHYNIEEDTNSKE